MKRSLYVSLLTIMYFSACQGSEELEQSQEKEYTVSIMARIGKTVSGARYLQDHENAIASFSKTDDIGVFMDNDSAVRWIFDGKHSKKCTFYTLRFGCSFAAVNTIKPQLL